MDYFRVHGLKIMHGLVGDRISYTNDTSQQQQQAEFFTNNILY
jgi:hypothetical protein